MESGIGSDERRGKINDRKEKPEMMRWPYGNKDDINKTGDRRRIAV